MSDAAALLAAVVAAPDDDTPRLVYADFLDDNHEPERAAFIRDQVACARDAGRHELDTYGTFAPWRDAALRNDPPRAPDVWGLAAEWLFPLAAWRRGFFEAPDLPVQVWEDHGARLLALHPIRRVRLDDAFGAIDTSPAGLDMVRVTQIDRTTNRVLDYWHQSKRWPGVKFDLPRPSPAERFEGLMRDAAALSYARNREALDLLRAAWRQVDFTPLALGLEQAASAARGYGAALAEAARPALSALARSVAALQPVHASRRDRRRKPRR